MKLKLSSCCISYWKFYILVGHFLELVFGCDHQYLLMSRIGALYYQNIYINSYMRTFKVETSNVWFVQWVVWCCVSTPRWKWSPTGYCGASWDGPWSLYLVSLPHKGAPMYSEAFPNRNLWNKVKQTAIPLQTCPAMSPTNFGFAAPCDYSYKLT